MANTEENMKAIIDNELDFEKDVGFPKRALTAKLLAALEAARLRGTKRKAEEAEQRVSDIPTYFARRRPPSDGPCLRASV